MRILIYSHFFTPSIGGVETIVLSLAAGLATLRKADGLPRFDVTVVTQTAGQYDTELPFKVVRQPNTLQLWRLLRSCQIVHLAGPALVPLLLARLAGRPVVVEHHGFQAICPNGQLFIEPSATPCPGHFMAGRTRECLRCNVKQGWLTSAQLLVVTYARRFLCSRVEANIAPTQWLAEMLNLPNVCHVSHGLEQMPQSLPAWQKPPVVAFQGRLVSTKGVSVFLEAAQILRKQGRLFNLLIIGDGPERRSLEDLSYKFGLSDCTRFAGRLPPSQLAAALSGATLMVVPSLGGEVFGLVIAENMLRGIPVLASDIGAFKEVLQEAGRTFRKGDASDLACQIGLLLDNPQQSARLGELGRQRVLGSYGKSNMIEKHARIYYDVSPLVASDDSHHHE